MAINATLRIDSLSNVGLEKYKAMAEEAHLLHSEVEPMEEMGYFVYVFCDRRVADEHFEAIKNIAIRAIQSGMVEVKFDPCS